MKKIPTLFKKQYKDNKYIGVSEEVTEGMEWVLDREGIATIKADGSCCAIIDDVLYKRYDAKKSKIPEGAIPCCEKDPITGHHPHWVKVSQDNPADKWFVEAFANTDKPLENGTYEAIGKHFQGNPYRLPYDVLVKHGMHEIDVQRNFLGIKEYLRVHNIEGIVFWKDGEPQCKIRRKDFGFPWNNGDEEKIWNLTKE